MIVAALKAGRGDNDATIPKELQAAWYASRWGVMPKAGGILDQPAGMLKRMAILENIYNATRSYWQSSDKATWAKSNDWAWELYARARQAEKELLNGN